MPNDNEKNNKKGNKLPKSDRGRPKNSEKRGRALPETSQQNPPRSVPKPASKETEK